MSAPRRSIWTLSSVLIALAILAAPSIAYAQTADGLPDVANITRSPYRLNYRRLTCTNHGGMRAYFSTVDLDPNLPNPPARLRPFGFQEDAGAHGGYKIMAPFLRADGSSVTAEEGFDPCAETTCVGVQCANSSKMMVQQYTQFLAYIVQGQAMQYDPYGTNRGEATGRCQCLDPVTLAFQPGLNIYRVDPTSPSAQQSDPVCSELGCAQTKSANALYYLLSATGTAEGCRCYKKQLDIIAPNERYPPIPSSRRPRPLADIGSGSQDEPSGSGSGGGGGGGGGGSGSGGTPDPIGPSTTLMGFLTSACPENTLSTVPPEAIANNASRVCCYFSDAQNVTRLPAICGDALLAVRGPGQVNCVSTIDRFPFQCCAKIDAGGGLSEPSRYCPGAYINNRGDAAAAPPPALVTAATAAILGSAIAFML